MATVRGLSNKSNALAKESPYCWRRIFPPLTGARRGQAGRLARAGRPGRRSLRPQGFRRLRTGRHALPERAGRRFAPPLIRAPRVSPDIPAPKRPANRRLTNRGTFRHSRKAAFPRHLRARPHSPDTPRAEASRHAPDTLRAGGRPTTVTAAGVGRYLLERTDHAGLTAHWRRTHDGLAKERPRRRTDSRTPPTSRPAGPPTGLVAGGVGPSDDRIRVRVRAPDSTTAGAPPGHSRRSRVSRPHRAWSCPKPDLNRHGPRASEV